MGTGAAINVVDAIVTTLKQKTLSNSAETVAFLKSLVGQEAGDSKLYRKTLNEISDTAKRREARKAARRKASKEINEARKGNYIDIEKAIPKVEGEVVEDIADSHSRYSSNWINNPSQQLEFSGRRNDVPLLEATELSTNVNPNWTFGNGKVNETITQNTTEAIGEALEKQSKGLGFDGVWGNITGFVKENPIVTAGALVAGGLVLTELLDED